MMKVLATLFAIGLLAPAVGLQTPQRPQQEVSSEDTLRINTNLVTLPVSVMDRNGRFVPDLKQSQFRLYEDGDEQEIAYFENADRPFTVALMLDVSDSTRLKLKDIQDAAVQFADQLRPGDRVLVIEFDRQVTIMCEATSDRQILREAINLTRTGGGTSLYNAVDMIFKQRLKYVPGGKAVVLFTDGVDTASLGATYESTAREAQELDALIYSIQYNTYEDASTIQTKALGVSQPASAAVTASGELLSVAYARGNRYLRLIADQSGGRFYYASSATDLREKFARIAAELRQQYSLGYYPKKKASASERRELKVRVSVPNVAVRARKSVSLVTTPD